MRKQKHTSMAALSWQESNKTKPVWVEVLQVTEFSKLSTVKQSYRHLFQKNQANQIKLAELQEAWRQAQEALS